MIMADRKLSGTKLSSALTSDDSLSWTIHVTRTSDWPTNLLYRVYSGPALQAGVLHGDRWHLNAACEAAWWIKTGHVETVFGGRPFHAREGQWMITGSGPRTQYFSPDATILSINYRWHDQRGRPAYHLKHPVVWEDADVPDLRARGLELAAFVERVVGNPASFPTRTTITLSDRAILTGRFHLWLGELGRLIDDTKACERVGEGFDPRLAAAREILDASPLNVQVDYDEVAHASNVSRSHLERLFRTEYQCTPHAYMDGRRIEYAKGELLGGLTQIKAISLALGFRHLSRFSAWFRGREGCSPREFRRFGPRNS